MSLLMTSTQMEGLAPAEQAEKALAYVLEKIQTDGHVAWYLGIGTQTFALLTEAYASLANKPVKEIRERFRPLNACNPARSHGEDEE